MKKSFPGYYRPTENEFSEMWSDCLFVLDANVLLNLYRYTLETSNEFLSILKQVAGQLWIPHQVALEYQRLRFDVIIQQRNAYDKVKESLKDICKSLESQMKVFQKHPFIDPQHLLERIRELFSEIEQELDEYKERHPDFWDDDPLRDELTELFEGKVGAPYTQTRLEEIYKEGKKRYDAKIPPGYADAATKTEGREYGDLILWYQIIDKVQGEKQPIVLVTDDRKEDWWWKPTGKTFGPRPELVQELLSKANVAFYMYAPERFMEYARDYLKQDVEQDAIDEVREVGRGHEYALRHAAELYRVTQINDELQRQAMYERIRPRTIDDWQRQYEQLYPHMIHELQKQEAIYEQLYPRMIHDLQRQAAMHAQFGRQALTDLRTQAALLAHKDERFERIAKDSEQHAKAGSEHDQESETGTSTELADDAT